MRRLTARAKPVEIKTEPVRKRSTHRNELRALERNVGTEKNEEENPSHKKNKAVKIPRALTQADVKLEKAIAEALETISPPRKRPITKESAKYQGNFDVELRDALDRIPKYVQKYVLEPVIRLAEAEDKNDIENFIDTIEQAGYIPAKESLTNLYAKVKATITDPSKSGAQTALLNFLFYGLKLVLELITTGEATDLWLPAVKPLLSLLESPATAATIKFFASVDLAVSDDDQDATFPMSQIYDRFRTESRNSTADFLQFLDGLVVNKVERRPYEDLEDAIQSILNTLAIVGKSIRDAITPGKESDEESEDESDEESSLEEGPRDLSEYTPSVFLATMESVPLQAFCFAVGPHRSYDKSWEQVNKIAGERKNAIENLRLGAGHFSEFVKDISVDEATKLWNSPIYRTAWDAGWKADPKQSIDKLIEVEESNLEEGTQLSNLEAKQKKIFEKVIRTIHRLTRPTRKRITIPPLSRQEILKDGIHSKGARTLREQELSASQIESEEESDEDAELDIRYATEASDVLAEKELARRQQPKNAALISDVRTELGARSKEIVEGDQSLELRNALQRLAAQYTSEVGINLGRLQIVDVYLLKQDFEKNQNGKDAVDYFLIALNSYFIDAIDRLNLSATFPDEKRNNIRISRLRTYFHQILSNLDRLQFKLQAEVQEGGEVGGEPGTLTAITHSDRILRSLLDKIANISQESKAANTIIMNDANKLSMLFKNLWLASKPTQAAEEVGHRRKENKDLVEAGGFANRDENLISRAHLLILNAYRGTQALSDIEIFDLYAKIILAMYYPPDLLQHIANAALSADQGGRIANLALAMDDFEGIFSFDSWMKLFAENVFAMDKADYLDLVKRDFTSGTTVLDLATKQARLEKWYRDRTIAIEKNEGDANIKLSATGENRYAEKLTEKEQEKVADFLSKDKDKEKLLSNAWQLHLVLPALWKSERREKLGIFAKHRNAVTTTNKAFQAAVEQRRAKYDALRALNRAQLLREEKDVEQMKEQPRSRLRLVDLYARQSRKTQAAEEESEFAEDNYERALLEEAVHQAEANEEEVEGARFARLARMNAEKTLSIQRTRNAQTAAENIMGKAKAIVTSKQKAKSVQDEKEKRKA